MTALSQDVTAVIASQHEHVKELIERVRQETGQGRGQAFHALRLALAVHETAEEQAIHPQALRQFGLHAHPRRSLHHVLILAGPPLVIP